MKGLNKQGECVIREKWRLFCLGHPIGGISGGNNLLETTERMAGDMTEMEK